MGEKDYVQELMVQVREIADGQIRIEGKLDVMKNDYNGKIEAIKISCEACREARQNKEQSIESEVKEIKEERKWLQRTIIGQLIITAFSAFAIYYGLKG